MHAHAGTHSEHDESSVLSRKWCVLDKKQRTLHFAPGLREHHDLLTPLGPRVIDKRRGHEQDTLRARQEFK